MNILRQGDILLIPAKRPAKLGDKISRDNGRIVLAYGEVTGHAHAILDREADLYAIPDTDDRFLEIMERSGVTLQHEEHAAIVLAPEPKFDGFIVRRQSEYGPEPRRVDD